MVEGASCGLTKILVDLRGYRDSAWGIFKRAPLGLLIALLLITAIPTARLVASSSEPKGGLKVVGLLVVCIAIGAFVPLVFPFAYVAYVSVTWYSITPAESL